jgi:hypothetical protein
VRSTSDDKGNEFALVCERDKVRTALTLGDARAVKTFCEIRPWRGCRDIENEWNEADSAPLMRQSRIFNVAVASPRSAFSGAGEPNLYTQV